MKIRRKLAKNCSIHGKNYEISGPYNFWTPVKSNIPDVWNWNCWTLFGSEIEVWGHGPLAPSPPLQWLRPWKFQLFWFSSTANYNRCVWSRPVKSYCATESLTVFIDIFRYPGLSSFSPGIHYCLFWINLWFENYFIRFTKRILLTY